MDASEAQAFARAWAQAWNDHDLEAILSHYSDEVVFHSPRIRKVTGADADFVSGKATGRTLADRFRQRRPPLDGGARCVVRGQRGQAVGL